jgi:hypothetical protein
MASLVLNGNTSGSVTISSPAVSGTTTLTLPTTSGTVVVTSGAQTIEFADGSASAPSITNSGDTNTGIFFSAADTIDFAEGGAAVGQFDSSANFKFNSGYGSVATAYGCRAWVNFNGTGTVAIRASANVTSITDNGTGDYTVNFTTAMPDANYSAVANASDTPTLNRWATLYQGFILAGSVRLVVAGSNSTPSDVTTCCVSIFR